MQYASGQKMMVGDAVRVDGMEGIIVCDFDNREFAEGYGKWDFQDGEMLGGGALSTGVMVLTEEAGLTHYNPGTGVIEPADVDGQPAP